MKTIKFRRMAIAAAILLIGLGSISAPVFAADTKKAKESPPLYNPSSGGKSSPVFIGQGDMAGAASKKSTTGMTGLLDRKPFKMQTRTVAQKQVDNVEAARRLKAAEAVEDQARQQIRAQRQAEIRAEYEAVNAKNQLKMARDPMRAADIMAAKDKKPEDAAKEATLAATQQQASSYEGKTVVLKTRTEEPGEKKPLRLFNVRER